MLKEEFLKKERNRRYFSSSATCRITLVVFARWPSGPPGPVGAADAPADAVTKAILAKGRRPVAANTLLCGVRPIKIFYPHLPTLTIRLIYFLYRALIDPQLLLLIGVMVSIGGIHSLGSISRSSE